MSNPWKTAAAPVEVESLTQIMLEETAKKYRTQKEMKHSQQISTQEVKSNKVVPNTKESTKSNADDSCNSDVTIAEVLQQQYDKNELKKMKKKNKNSKLSISYQNYFNIPPNVVDDSDCEDTNTDPESKAWDRLEANIKEFGFQVKATKVLSHLKQINLKQKQKTEQRYYKPEVLDEKNSHLRGVMGLDQATRNILFKIIKIQVLEEVNGMIATGKKSVVFHATGNTCCAIAPVPLECAVKVYKTKVHQLKSQDRHADSRFNEIFFKLNPNEKVHMLAEKEMFNLIHMKKFHINCPDMVCFKKHVLVMSLIGKNAKPAPNLYELTTEEEIWQIIYNKIVTLMRKLYKEAGMVHADLTPKNVLWWNNKCWFIDVSQSVHTNHPDSMELLLQDCQEVIDFFEYKEIPDMKKTAEELFKYITGNDYVALSNLNEENLVENDSSTSQNALNSGSELT